MDAIFKALNDPARRALLDSLRQKDGQSLSELEEQLDMTRFGVMKHLKVLEDASLIVTRKKGRFKHHYLNALPLQEVIDRWIDPFLAKPAARAVIELKSKLEGTAPMLDTALKPDFVMETFIRCPQASLWDALRDPDAMMHYHFMAARIEKDADNRVTYFTPSGDEMLVCREMRFEPMTRLETTFEPKWNADGATPSRVVYTIIPEGDTCRLVVEHFDLTHPVVQGEGVADGWARMLAGLKTWLETGQDAKFGSAGQA